MREPLDAPVVFTYHTKFDVDIERAVGKGYIKEKIIKEIVKNIEACDEVWVVSEGAGKNLKNLGYRGEYVVMPNGVDIPKGKVPKEDIQKVTEGYDLPEGAPVFLFVGRMAWYKGLDIILEALEKLKKSGKDFRMIFVGGGLDMAEVKKYSEELGLSENCIFTGAVRDRNEIRAFYSRADLFLFPSVYDTNGLVVREAAACSLPSILIEGSCAAEGITDGETGFLTENDPESFYKKLLFLCENRDILKKVGETAMEKIYISWEDSVKNAAERYKTVLENYRAGKYKKEDTFAGEWLETEGEFLNYISKGKDRYSKAAKKLYRKRIKLKKKIIEKSKDIFDSIL